MRDLVTINCTSTMYTHYHGSGTYFPLDTCHHQIYLIVSWYTYVAFWKSTQRKLEPKIRTLCDFRNSTDIFVNPSFLPFCTQKAPWISSKNRYLGAKSCTWPSWILNVSRIVKIIHSVPCSQLSIRWLELHNLCNILWSLFSKYFLKMLISY